MPAGFDTLLEGLDGYDREVALFGYLDRDWRLLGIRHVIGSARSVSVPVRTVVRDMLTFDARWLVLAHNHPSGDPRPSTADLALTRRLARGLNAIGAQVFDHLVLARGGATSLRAEGWL